MHRRLMLLLSVVRTRNVFECNQKSTTHISKFIAYLNNTEDDDTETIIAYILKHLMDSRMEAIRLVVIKHESYGRNAVCIVRCVKHRIVGALQLSLTEKRLTNSESK